jgi:ABC-type multidrug transport system fused ATPase/permease subunit
MDYDKILVLEEGRIVEYGSPLELLAKNMDQEDAWFKRMVQQTGVSQKD